MALKHTAVAWSSVVTGGATFASGVAAASVYSVDQSAGDDRNDGSQGHPLATISACASMAGPGDTCEVHAGTYRETVSPARFGTASAPIRFEAAAGECVTVSGLEAVPAEFVSLGADIGRSRRRNRSNNSSPTA